MVELIKNSLLAVSGGADSMYLLHMYKDVENIHVAHVNYNIRPDSSLDTNLVKRYCEANDIPCHVHEELSPPTSGVEEWARDIRYKFFKEVMSSNNLDYVVTAHNANDQAETVLMRILRGTGIRGLAGIHKHNLGLNAYRPLINLKKSFIYEECKKCGTPYREDSTNSDTKYLRNWFRHEYVSDELIEPLSKIAESVQELIPKLSSMASDLYRNNVYFSDGNLIIEKSVSQDPLLFHYLTDLTSSKIQWTEKLFDMIFSEDPSTKKFNITPKIICDKRKKRVIVIKGL